jgi:hypothetical protein
MEKGKVEIKDISEAPNLQELKDKFNVSENDVIISYGDSIFCPNKQMTRDLLVHELVHCDRQGFNRNTARHWWEKYIDDKQFRLVEEATAFRQQYLYCCKIYKDKNRQNKILCALGSELASERYGNIVSSSDARLLISPIVYKQK